MKCPHCLENFFENWNNEYIGRDQESEWQIRYCTCPTCLKFVIELGRFKGSWQYQLIRPRSISRSPIPTEVPPEFTEDYIEACLVLSDSPKASAALSRRELQMILREKANTKTKDLADQIQETLDSKTLPSYLSDSLDAVRVIGNFAAHPIKSKTTGEIVDVEPGEAEWNLDVIEGLFDFYFVQAKKLEEKRNKLNAKLVEAGKPPLR